MFWVSLSSISLVVLVEEGAWGRYPNKIQTCSDTFQPPLKSLPPPPKQKKSLRHWVYQTIIVIMFAFVCLIQQGSHISQLFCSILPSSFLTFSLKVGGEFNWDVHTQELILAAFFYGFVFTQILGGWLSDRFGMKWVVGLGILASSVCSLLGPVAAYAGFGWYFTTRFVSGLAEVGAILSKCLNFKLLRHGLQT